MNKIFRFALILGSLTLSACGRPLERPAENSIPSTMSIYEIPLKDLEGKSVDLSSYKGKKLLIVNTASHCGFTGQYKDLQQLADTYAGKVVVLGFPCNDFGRQEPGDATEIREFCSKNYAVTFPMFEKVHVKGEGVSPLYSWLTDSAKNGWNSEAPSWNFCKYLIDENGQLLSYFPSSVNPMDEKIVSHLK